MLVEELSRERDLWIFLDDRQRFWKDRQLPAELVRGAAELRLLEQQRSPEPVWRFASDYAGAEAPGRAAEAGPGLQGGELVRVLAADDARLLDRVAHELNELRKGGAEPGDIAVLTLAGQTNSELLQLPRLGSHDLVRADDPAAPDRIVAETFLRFKGLERPFVLLTELVPGAISHTSGACTSPPPAPPRR